MQNYQYLLDLALILLTTKVFGIISKRFQLPQVVGALLAGLIFGPACLGLIHMSNFVQASAEIGVIVLMFCAGLETDLNELKNSGKSSIIIAIMGVVVPLIGGYFVSHWFNREGMIVSDASGSIFLQNIFVGIILTATSVSITVETLKELGKLKTRSGNAILGAAILDDILGIIGLTIVTSMADTTVNIWLVLFKIFAFLVFSMVVGIVFNKFYKNWSETNERPMHRHVIIAFVFCLLMSYIAEHFFGVADITGAFIAGLVLSAVPKSNFIASKFDVLSYLYLSPIFFASIGLKVSLPNMNLTILMFAVVLAVVAILTKVLGCGFGAKICGYKDYQCRRIGVGMISRGEVALIVADKGTALGLLGSSFLGPIVIVVVITTIITPILLKMVFKVPEAALVPTIAPQEGFAVRYEVVEQLRK